MAEHTPSGGGGGDALIFLAGFMIAPAAYSTLLTPLARAGVRVITPQLYRHGPAALLGHVLCQEEARRAVELVQHVRTRFAPDRLWLAGHSRGGQAAWRCASLLADDHDAPGLNGLILVDPVDGSGRAPSGPEATADSASFTIPTLIIGAGVGGRCAPEQVNHEQFARANPSAAHVVVTELGHADILAGRRRTLGRRLCGGAIDPDPGRAAVTTLMRRFLDPSKHDLTEPLSTGVQWLRRSD